MEIRTRLKAELAEVEWKSLLPHLKRDALILVSSELDLVETAVCLAADDNGRAEAWISTNQLGKPDAEHIKSWEKEPNKLFKMLIVQPFVLIQS